MQTYLEIIKDRTDSKSVTGPLVGAVIIVPKSVSAATYLDVISYLRSIPDARMRRGARFPAWYLLVAVLGILSGCQSLRDLERFPIRQHNVLTVALGIELGRLGF